MGIKFFPHKFNNFLFQQAGKVSSDFDFFDWDIRGLTTNNTARNNNRPKYSGTILGQAVKVVNVKLLNAEQDRDSLVTAMNVSSQQQLPLYALDQLGNEYFCMAKCVGLNPEAIGDGVQDKEGSFGYIFEVDDPTWISVKEYEDIWDILADEDVHTITVGGNQIARPVFEIIPGPPTYWPYTKWIKNYNPIALAQTDGIDITGGGWNTAALITANKMEIDGRDIRVFMDGDLIPYWFGGGGINSTTTEIWIRQKWNPGSQMALKVALSGVTTPALIEWEVTDDVKAALSRMPIKGIIRAGTEEISYKNLKSALCRANIVERAIRGTAIGAHSIGDVCYWVEHDIKVIYGNAVALVRNYSAQYKPVFNLATSTNISRVYEEFADTEGLRAGSFIPQRIVNGRALGEKKSRTYTGNHAAVVESNPATEMGMEIGSYQSEGRAKPDTADLGWMFYHPATPLTVTITGEKFRSFAGTSWPSIAALESSVDGVNWVQEWNEVTPATQNSWTALSNTSTETLATGSLYFRFRLAGSINALVSNFQRMEIDSCTVTLDSARIIQVGMSAEEASYQFELEIRNNTTDESLFIDYPAKEGVKLIVDTENMEVTYRGMNALRAITWDSSRTDWLHLEPGENDLQYYSDLPGTLRVTTATQNRAL